MRVTVPCLAKLNLDLRVLHKRSDNYHELRTIFQTISLKDSLTIEFQSQKRSQIEIQSSIEIAENLVVRSAKTVLEHLKVTGWVRFVLDKRIPIGAGLGGGSSDAAAVLIALPALIGKRIAQPDLVRLAESLGSDVPFFLHGGTALGMGRGSELFPVPDLPPHPAVVVTPGIHISTPAAYRALNRAALTSRSDSPILREFQTLVWNLADSSLGQLPLQNDFEEAVFGMHKEIAAQVRKLRNLGAKPALMTGSGSAVFGVFQTAAEARAAIPKFSPGSAHAVRFVSRRQYRSAWRRALGPAAEASRWAG